MGKKNRSKAKRKVKKLKAEKEKQLRKEMEAASKKPELEKPSQKPSDQRISHDLATEGIETCIMNAVNDDGTVNYDFDMLREVTKRMPSSGTPVKKKILKQLIDFASDTTFHMLHIELFVFILQFSAKTAFEYLDNDNDVIEIFQYCVNAIYEQAFYLYIHQINYMNLSEGIIDLITIFIEQSEDLKPDFDATVLFLEVSAFLCLSVFQLLGNEVKSSQDSIEYATCVHFQNFQMLHKYKHELLLGRMCFQIGLLFKQTKEEDKSYNCLTESLDMFFEDLTNFNTVSCIFNLYTAIYYVGSRRPHFLKGTFGSRLLQMLIKRRQTNLQEMENYPNILTIIWLGMLTKNEKLVEEEVNFFRTNPTFFILLQLTLTTVGIIIEILRSSMLIEKPIVKRILVRRAGKACFADKNTDTKLYYLNGLIVASILTETHAEELNDFYIPFILNAIKVIDRTKPLMKSWHTYFLCSAKIYLSCSYARTKNYAKCIEAVNFVAQLKDSYKEKTPERFDVLTASADYIWGFVLYGYRYFDVAKEAFMEAAKVYRKYPEFYENYVDTSINISFIQQLMAGETNVTKQPSSLSLLFGNCSPPSLFIL